MNKYQEALNNIRFYCGHANRDEYLNPKVFEELNIIQKLIDKHDQLELENFDLRQKLNAEGECCVMLQKKVKKLKSIIQILNRIYGFKLQYIPYNGYPELLIPDMTSDELTKEEYELLQEEIEEL